jgi:hypothetical protein
MSLNVPEEDNPSPWVWVADMNLISSQLSILLGKVILLRNQRKHSTTQLCAPLAEHK